MRKRCKRPTFGTELVWYELPDFSTSPVEVPLGFAKAAMATLRHVSLLYMHFPYRQSVLYVIVYVDVRRFQKEVVNIVIESRKREVGPSALTLHQK